MVNYGRGRYRLKTRIARIVPAQKLSIAHITDIVAASKSGNPSINGIDKPPTAHSVTPVHNKTEHRSIFQYGYGIFNALKG